MSLTTHDIVAAGLEILDNYGLEDLSMRRLAQLLDVNTLNQADYIELMSPHMPLTTSCNSYRYHELWLAHQ